FQNKFKPLKLLGQGGFGCVFEVEQNVMGRVKWPRAVKRIPLSGSENEVDTALREVATLNSLDHPGIVKFYDAWHEEPPEGWQVYTYCILFVISGAYAKIPYVDNCSFLYIEMELCKSTLAEWLSDNKHRDLRRMTKWFEQIVTAVSYIHSKGIIHRDLKPCNILFTSKDHLKICDIGIGVEKIIEDGVETTFTRTCTSRSEYMSPEQMFIFSHITTASDIFTLGLILAELIVVMNYKMKVEVFDNFRDGKRNSIFEDEAAVK
ncbi:hypothetical protein PENTCL1PPCAC_8547, partial [Pristionchus entomophagus]